MHGKTDKPFTARDEHLEKFPDISGNSVNGLGEREFRPPTPIFWRDPDTLAHGELQKMFYEHVGRVKEYRTELSQDTEKRGPETLDPVAPERKDDSPDNWTRKIKDFALANESDLVGIARIDPAWVYEDSTMEHEWIVVLGIAMDLEELSQLPPEPPNLRSADEVSRQYNRAARASKALANHIRAQGWPADAHTGPMTGPLTLIPAAIEAGLGELGKHGSMINDRFGASFRLAAVTTDLPLLADHSRDFGVDDFCLSCQLCTTECPPDAIFREKQWVRGEKRWYVDFDRCIPYFIDTIGCGICIAVCPWSKPGVGPRLAEKMMRRRKTRGDKAGNRVDA